MAGPSISEETRYEVSKIFDNIPAHILNPGLWKR
jgi:hypothetical protein